MEGFKTEYRIIGRFVKDDKPHVVDWSPRWTEQDAKQRLEELIRAQEKEKRQGGSTTVYGSIGVSTPYLPEYELVDLKIQSRQVSKWL